MKKVTVKHYLNTNISLRQMDSNGKYLNDMVYHPVYIQISFARKTTQIRSYTEILLTKKDYEYYQNGDYEKIINVESFKSLICEPKRVQSAIEYLLNKRENDSHKNDFLSGGAINKFDDIRYDVENLMEPLEFKLIELGWEYLAFTRKQWLKMDVIDIHDAFRIDENLLKSLNIIKQTTNFDLSPFFPQTELEFWNNVNLLIERYKEDEFSFIDFIGNYESLIKSIDEIKNKNAFIKEITDLINYTT